MSLANQSNPIDAPWLHIVQKQVASIQYGVVQITVHSGEVVQIERTEKTRIEKGRTGLDAKNPVNLRRLGFSQLTESPGAANQRP